MIVFIRRIPKNTTTDDICEFIIPALKGGFFSGAGYIVHCEILKFLDIRTGQIECHGLIKLNSDKIAKYVIRKLNGQKLNCKPVKVSEYVIRSRCNERRQDFNAMKSYLNNRRVADRRRYKNIVVIGDEFPVITSDYQFAINH